MELLIIAAVLVFVLSRGGTLGLTTGSGTYYQAGQQGLNPNGPFGAGQFAIQQSSQAIGEVNAGIGVGVNVAEKFATAGSSFAKAIPIVGEAVAAVADILLGQHTARLKGAISENQLIPASVNAFDADIKEIVAAYNSGSASAAQCAGAIYQMWNSLHDYMRQNATGPGRAWREVESGIGSIQPNSPPCDKTCTAECCVFWSNFHPLLANLYAFFTTGKPLLVGGGARYTGWPPTNSATGPFTLNVLVVSPPNDPAYGNYSRAAYTLTLQGA
jgi:hypothetical protein